MMNIVAIGLIATSLVASALFSPTPQSNAAKQDEVIVKGGHRAVVIEYGDDIRDGNTKVSISSQQPAKGEVDEKISRAAASVAGVAQDVKEGRPRELICDAYGRCKHKMSDMWSKAKGTATEAEEAVEEVVEEVVDKAKGLASEAGRMAEESVEGVKENAKEKVKEVGKVAEKVREKTGEKVDEVKGKTSEIVEETGEKVKKGKKELANIATRGKEVAVDAIWYVCSMGYGLVKETLSSMINVMQLLGFAVAYGMSIWVTFMMSHVLAGVLPKQQFGMVQSRVYPVYFRAMVGSIGLALLGHLLGHRGKVFRNKADMLQVYNLLSCLLFVLGNSLFLEPRATRVMFNKMKLEKEEGRGRDHITATRVMDTVVGDSAGPIPTTTAATTTEGTTVPTTTTATTTTSIVKSDDEAKTKLAMLDCRLKKLNSYSSFLNIMTLMGLTWHLVYLSQRLRANC